MCGVLVQLFFFWRISAWQNGYCNVQNLYSLEIRCIYVKGKKRKEVKKKIVFWLLQFYYWRLLFFDTFSSKRFCYFKHVKNYFLGWWLMVVVNAIPLMVLSNLRFSCKSWDYQNPEDLSHALDNCHQFGVLDGQAVVVFFFVFFLLFYFLVFFWEEDLIVISLFLMANFLFTTISRLCVVIMYFWADTGVGIWTDWHM